jgi:hypothetical protein
MRFRFLYVAVLTVCALWDVPARAQGVEPTTSGGLTVGSYCCSTNAPTNGLIVSGSVGIGTALPASTLDVTGNGIHIASSGSGGSNVLWNNSGTLTWGATGLTVSGSVTASGSTGYLPYFSSSTTLGSSIAFQTGSTLQIGSGGSTTALYVDSNLAGATAFASGQGAWIEWNASPGGGMTAFVNDEGGGTGGWQFINMNSGGSILATPVTIQGGGNVGIGTASPQATLDVTGYMRLAKNASQPVACSSTNDGAIALTALYTLCICNGGSTTWVQSKDGSTACTW